MLDGKWVGVWANVGASIFHFVMIIVLIAAGTVPLLQLGLLGINGPVAYALYRYNTKSNRQITASRLSEAIEPVKSEYECSQFETRHFEQKLVDSGVIKAEEMSVCNDDNCANCAPPRRQKAAALTRKPTRDMVRVDGLMVSRPAQVPIGAKAERIYKERWDEHYILWTWVAKFGETGYFKQRLESAVIESADGSIVKYYY